MCGKGKIASLAPATILALAVVFAAGFAAAPGVAAGDYPNKEIHVIIPFGAGGQSDLTARKLAEIIKKYNFLPQPILVVNMPGANTMNGLNAVLDAKPDGYTLLLHHTDLVAQRLYSIIPCHWTDFDMICQVMDINLVMSVKGDAPWNSAAEFIADARANPGKFKLSAPAPGGATYLSGMMFLDAAGLRNNEVVVRATEGGGTSAEEITSGTAAIRPAPTSDVARFVAGGQEKVLFLLDTVGRPEFPGATLAEDLGLQDSIIKHSSGIFAPKGTPAEVKEQVAAAVKAAIETPDFQEFMALQVCNPKYLAAAEWAGLYKEIEKIFADIIAKITKK